MIVFIHCTKCLLSKINLGGPNKRYLVILIVVASEPGVNGLVDNTKSDVIDCSDNLTLIFEKMIEWYFFNDGNNQKGKRQ